MTRRRMISLAVLALLVLLLPGWDGRLEPAPHEDVLAAARTAAPGDVFGVTREGERRGEEWHAQYHGSTLARLLHGAGMRATLTRVIPPAYAAHVPVGAERADGYFRVRTTVHWPWWRPGGGVDWSDPRLRTDRPDVGGPDDDAVDGDGGGEESGAVNDAGSGAVNDAGSGD